MYNPENTLYKCYYDEQDVRYNRHAMRLVVGISRLLVLIWSDIIYRGIRNIPSLAINRSFVVLASPRSDIPRVD